METTKTPILIIGAMGTVGSCITKCALQEPTLLVNIMDCDLTDKELCKMVEKEGGKCCKGDICDTKTLKDITKGMHTVISTISTDDEKIMIDGQMAMMKICKENGVERCVPSDFSINVDKLHPDELTCCPMLRSKKKLHEIMSTTTGTKTIPPTLCIQTGTTMETLFKIMRETGVGCHGDPTVKLDLTCCEDVGKLVVAAVCKKDLCGTIGLVGCTSTMGEVVDTYNKVRGTKLECKKTGTLEDLKKKSEKLRKEGDMKGSEICSTLAIICDPRAKIEKTHNTMIPTVKTMTVEDFLKVHPEIKLD